MRIKLIILKNKHLAEKSYKSPLTTRRGNVSANHENNIINNNMINNNFNKNYLKNN
jgi:hypothetical protein